METHIEEVAVEYIVIGKRIRPYLSDGTIQWLMESMTDIGLLQPIAITRRNAQCFLVAGAHRLQAARRLGWQTIRCAVLTNVEADQIELAEIDENLIREDLSPALRALSTERRKEIYERRHPETAYSSRPGRRGKNDPEVGSFVDDTAKKTRRSRSTVAQDAKRGKGLKSIKGIENVVGTSLDKGDELDALTKMKPDQQVDVINRAAAGEKVSAKTELKKASRAEKEKSLAQVTDRISEQIGHQLYNVIYADPAWEFKPFSQETGMDRAAGNHYPTKPVEVFEALDVDGAAAKDCVLFLWATTPMLREAMELMEAWGFKYKSHLIWHKEGRAGTGYWARSRHEPLLIGTRGNIPAPAPGNQPESVISAPVGKHSEKPEIFYEIIEGMYPTVPKLEMFARERRGGWDWWGNEVCEPELEAL